MQEVIEKLSRFENNKLWSYHIKIPDDVAEQFIDGKDRRIVCTFNDDETIHCALMPSPKGYFILINQRIVKKMHLHLGEAVKLKIRKDTSKYGMPVAKEFETCLNDEPLALEYFEALTAGKQRNLIHLVNQVKSPDIKIRRSLAIVEHLITEKGKVNHKALNQLIKRYNQQFRL